MSYEQIDSCHALQYNIMTSCDNNLIRYVTIQIYSISASLKTSIVHFYLLHRDISDESLQILEALCNRLGNILFHAIRVTEAEKYDAIAKHGGGWCGEAYFPICAHQLLPEYVERVLYVDAGDVIFTGDISPFYNSDFEGQALIATSIRYKVRDQVLVPYEEKDLYEITEGFPGICRGLFNSGSYIMNLNKLRDAQLTIDDWLDFSQMLCELSGKQDTSHIYWGDQGFMSAAFVGDIKIYNYPQIKNLWHMPYNFCLWYYDRMNVSPAYSPAIVHFAGAQKPWNMRYLITLNRFSSGDVSFNTLKIGQAEWYYLWHEFAICTDDILKDIGF